MCKHYKAEFMVIWNYPVNKHLPWSWHNFITFRHHLRSNRRKAGYTHRHLGARVIDEDHLRFLSVKQNRHRLLPELIICGTKRDTWADGPLFCIACLAGTPCARNNSLPKVKTALKTACNFGRNNFSHTRCNGSININFGHQSPRQIVFLQQMVGLKIWNVTNRTTFTTLHYIISYIILFIILYCITLYYIILYHISYYIMSCHVMSSCNVM